MNIGFIGAGSMGSLLIEAFIIAEAVEPNQISVSNRTYSKVEQLACKFPGLQAKQTNTAVVQHADIVFYVSSLMSLLMSSRKSNHS